MSASLFLLLEAMPAALDPLKDLVQKPVARSGSGLGRTYRCKESGAGAVVGEPADGVRAVARPNRDHRLREQQGQVGSCSGENQLKQR